MRYAFPFFICLTSAALAQTPTAPESEPLPPPPMRAPSGKAAAPETRPPAESGAEVIEPQVTIVRRGKNVIEEYRVGGQLYMVKIIPAKGYPYYLIDSDGDGNLETRSNELSNPEVPQWVLFRW